ncbi:hypothetical protein PFICI_06191 [Pestalotiopsis fici W106-1]|uniref:FAS1 domain-containing protein n=1 Tax=Pestalotiopsis fici (strain W106-1 / CGMCC3.15140) TaxID=1229662 RepID=W3X597_PESFW|nr:uncharacterized protein PFICI_06191 [Pestalotiopsis fici W106-1]ETS81189.1 hypothetical protein PFICI_06191 [Pestalotiopsis fici W106-1]
MKSINLYSVALLLTTATSQLLVLPPDDRPARPNRDQRPLDMDPTGPGGFSLPPFLGGGGGGSGSVVLSDVVGKERSINLFAGFTRDVESVSQRLDDRKQNSTVLAPLNSAVERLPRKPWEDARDYDTLGAEAYEGDDGQDRARRNLGRFAEAHVVPVSPWEEGDKVKTLLGDREVWWETKDGKKVILPDNIEVDSVASKVGNGEVWIIKGVRNYA